MNLLIAFGVWVAASVTSGSVVAQSAESAKPEMPAYKLRVKVDEVAITFHAADVSGRAVNDLKLDELRLLEDSGTTGTIVGLQSRQDLPIRAGLLLDTSASMQNHRVQDRQIAMDYGRKMLRQTTDEAFVMDFGHSVTLMQPWTHDSEALALAAREIAPSGGVNGTALFDAIFETCHGQFGSIDHAASGNFLLLFTDGEDNASSTTMQAAVDMCQKNSTAIYVFRAECKDPGDSTGPATLARLTQETGGRVFHGDDSLERVDADLKMIDADLRNQYRLMYRPAVLKHDGAFHPIVLLGPDRVANVTVRSGYYAPAH
jgi:Ca-activated chloride channel homolog